MAVTRRPVTVASARLATSLVVVVTTLAGCAATTVDGATADDATAPVALSSTADATSAPAAGATSESLDRGGVVEVSTLEDGTCPDDTLAADFPDVVGARLTPVDGRPGEYDVAVTLCSRYDTPARYADAWRVVTPDGDVLGTRVLLHDHATEQPFTRSLSGTLTVPDGVTTVVVEARDQANGWGGATLEVDLAG